MEINKYLDEFNLSNDMLLKLRIYYDFVVQKNKDINLTGITEIEDFYIKHFYDSLKLLYLLKDKKNLLDIGSGAGFPGIVLAIASPNTNIYIIDSLSKRIAFLKEVVDLLNLKNVHLINDRAENYSKVKVEFFDLVTARAVARLNILMEISIQLVKVGGLFIPLKTNDESEFNDAIYASKELGCIFEHKISYDLPKERGNRLIYIFKKTKHTNKIYPRSYSIIKKKPLCQISK